IYLFMNHGTFAVILCMRRDGRMVEEIGDLAGLSRTRPGLAFALGIFMFSMAGIPPLAGFFAKIYVFLAAIDAGLYVLAVIGVLASVVGAFYYLRIVKLMYFDDPLDDAPIESRADTRTLLSINGLALLLLGIFPQWLLGMCVVALTR
ncbi:MAG: NADH-quinone oxidoreductase subunit N, partial [Casimicrobiaceae bacterium]